MLVVLRVVVVGTVGVVLFVLVKALVVDGGAVGGNVAGLLFRLQVGAALVVVNGRGFDVML